MGSNNNLQEKAPLYVDFWLLGPPADNLVQYSRLNWHEKILRVKISRNVHGQFEQCQIWTILWYWHLMQLKCVDSRCQVAAHHLHLILIINCIEYKVENVKKYTQIIERSVTLSWLLNFSKNVQKPVVLFMNDSHRPAVLWLMWLKLFVFNFSKKLHFLIFGHGFEVGFFFSDRF